nr:uncharacterized protein CTRU02_02519 [Colletotrichum truncatum]KAF6798545.1 hypothetical protein CTRU02_02519 [Colletotrichum truncatum]
MYNNLWTWRQDGTRPTAARRTGLDEGARMVLGHFGDAALHGRVSARFCTFEGHRHQAQA